MYNLDTWEGRYAAVHNVVSKKFGEKSVYGIIGTPTEGLGEFYETPLAVTAMKSKVDAKQVLSTLLFK